MKSISRLYERLDDASEATEALVRAGFDPASISLIAPRGSQSLGFDAMDDMPESTEPEQVKAGAALGVTAGGLLGATTGLLMGLGLLVIPGVGPALAMGPLASALTGAAVGGATGGLAGALAREGVPQLDSNEYSRAVRRGSTLLFLQVPDDRLAEAARILDSHRPVPTRDDQEVLEENPRSRLRPRH